MKTQRLNLVVLLFHKTFILLFIYYINLVCPIWQMMKSFVASFFSFFLFFSIFFQLFYLNNFFCIIFFAFTANINNLIHYTCAHSICIAEYLIQNKPRTFGGNREKTLSLFLLSRPDSLRNRRRQSTLSLELLYIGAWKTANKSAAENARLDGVHFASEILFDTAVSRICRSVAIENARVADSTTFYIGTGGFGFGR